MTFLDIILLLLGLIAGVWAFLNGSDALYKLFLGLIIGFLMYWLVAGQAEVLQYIPSSQYDGYQVFLSKYDTSVLSFLLFLIPVLGLIFMLNTRLIFKTREKSLSQILLGLLLPVFLVGILANLSEGSILSQSPFWQKIFNFFENSGIYKIFTALPWGIFLLLIFLVFYKSIFILLYSFGLWLYREVFMGFFRSWNEEKKLQKSSSSISEEESEDDD